MSKEDFLRRMRDQIANYCSDRSNSDDDVLVVLDELLCDLESRADCIREDLGE